jgi:predicted nucleic acid-binding protein
MSWLIDTSVLIGTIHEGNPRQAIAISALESLVNNKEVFIVPQNIFEFWAVATRPASANGLGLPIEKAAKESDRIVFQFILKQDNELVFDNWESLVRKFRVSGKETHDARLVAAMLAHDIRNILTFNVKDFKRYAGTVDAFDPQDVIDGRSAV